MSESKESAVSRLRISEKQRTAILIALIVFAVGFIYWIQSGIDQNFVDTL